MNTKFRPLSLAVAIAALLAGSLAGTSALAATASDPMVVSITLTNSCTIDAPDMPFGSTTTLTANIDTSTVVAVTCSGANPVSISFNAGTGTGSTIASRLMSIGASATTVSYNIYRETGRTTVLGNTAATDTIDFTSTGSGTVDNRTIFGRVPVQAAKPNGLYESTVVATLTF